MSSIKPLIYSGIGGLLYTAGFPLWGSDHSVFFLPIIGVFLFLKSLSWQESQNFKEQLFSDILCLFAFSLTYCLSGYYWIPYTLLEFGKVTFPFNYILGALLSFIILPQYLVFIFIKRLFIKVKFLNQNFYFKSSLIALVLTLLENFVPQQFPAHLGHPWLQLAPNLGLAPVFGAPIFSFISYLLAASCLVSLDKKRKNLLGVAVFIIFLIANITNPIEMKKNSEQFKIKAVQPNIRNDLKLSAEGGAQLSLGEVFLHLKQTSLKGEKADVIIWPETAYPLMLEKKELEISYLNIPTTIREVITLSGTPIVFGGYDKAADFSDDYFETEYNSVFHISKNLVLKNVYHKMKLIPFGESLPFGPLNRLFSHLIKNISFFAKGSSYTLFGEGKAKFTTAICYEILFSSFIRNYLNNVDSIPNFIINLTNDSWYGDTSEPHQHLFLSHWRALEFGLPIVRVTNTGISSVLFPDGSESERIKIFKQGSKIFKVSLEKREKTLFQKFGLWLTLIAGLLITLISLIFDKITRLKL